MEAVQKLFYGKAHIEKLAMELPLVSLWVTHHIAVFKGKLTNFPYLHKTQGR